MNFFRLPALALFVVFFSASCKKEEVKEAKPQQYECRPDFVIQEISPGIYRITPSEPQYAGDSAINGGVRYYPISYNVAAYRFSDENTDRKFPTTLYKKTIYKTFDKPGFHQVTLFASGPFDTIPCGSKTRRFYVPNGVGNKRLVYKKLTLKDASVFSLQEDGVTLDSFYVDIIVPGIKTPFRTPSFRNVKKSDLPLEIELNYPIDLKAYERGMITYTQYSPYKHFYSYYGNFGNTFVRVANENGEIQFENKYEHGAFPSQNNLDEAVFFFYTQFNPFENLPISAREQYRIIRQYSSTGQVLCELELEWK